MKNSRNIAIIVSAVLIAFGVVVIFAGIRMFDKKANENENKEKEHEQNKVTLDNFTYSILKLETNKDNLVYSPLSIKYALSMLNEGASGTTKEEIDNLIKDLSLTKYDNIENVLSLANSVFIRDMYKNKVNPDFTNALQSNYNAEVVYDEFKNADNVNKWIENKTFKIIKNMLRDEQVQDKDVKMLLINALAIDMEWLNQFENSNTKSEAFTKENGDKINVAMMHNESKTDKFYKDEDYTVLAMPFRDYNGTNLEFVAIMPNKEELNKVLTSDDMGTTINNLLDKMATPNNQNLNISLPRFEYEYTKSLKSDLNTMGIKEAFTPNADFTKISDTGLHVDEVLHKANIKCSERGVKAAAATVIIMKDNAMMPPEQQLEQVELKYDKPFMYIIRDTNTGEVWFVGTVYEPLLWDNVIDNYW
jgi:serine protease inhibitor